MGGVEEKRMGVGVREHHEVMGTMVWVLVSELIRKFLHLLHHQVHEHVGIVHFLFFCLESIEILFL